MFSHLYINLISTITEAATTASHLQVTVTIASINTGIIRSIVAETSQISQWQNGCGTKWLCSELRFEVTTKKGWLTKWKFEQHWHLYPFFLCEPIKGQYGLYMCIYILYVNTFYNLGKCTDMLDNIKFLLTQMKLNQPPTAVCTFTPPPASNVAVNLSKCVI